MTETNNEHMDPIVAQWVDQVRAAQADKTPLRLIGSDSKHFYGHPTEGETMVLTEHQGVIDYEPSELVITVKGGTPVAEIEELLASKNQFLPFEPPLFGADATIAGCVASGLAGPRRPQAGGVRDFVLGVQLIDGQGRHMTFGGQVMKNVAGYDVSRLLSGSLGTLGILTELSIKVLPKPVKELTLQLDRSQKEALHKINTWSGQPIPISASLWHDDQLFVRLSGAPNALEVAQETIQGTPLDEDQAQTLWQEVREQKYAWFQAKEEQANKPLWRLSVPSTTEPILDDHPQLIEWGGALRWCFSDLPAETLRAQVEAVGGTATVFRQNGADLAVFHPLDPVILGIQQRLKEKFDPAGIFNPGRIYPGEL
ncbi:MAG TPA: glycolate oxidase subunit GlcE [Paenalcaligenes sp.]|nr:glycolate oxidase subunit GlcE [Paenalcaligenes sp.]